VAPGIAAVLAAVLLGVWHFSGKPVDDPRLVEKLVVRDVTRSEPSIAVLPFESVEGDERWTRLGRGLAADIASELALNDWLYVTVPESLINVAFGELPAGRMLDVQFVLSGTIQTQGDEFRVSARLTDVSTREILWSQTWTELQHDIFTVQDRIVARIGSSLASTYSGVVVQAGLKRARRKLTSDLNAYEHYLIGFELLHRFDPANQPEAIEHLETALEIDPSFAGALVTLSVLQFIQGDHTEGDAARRWLEASQDSAYRAYAIDPNNPNVLWNVARAYALDGQLDIAGKTLRRAVAIAPNNADVLMISAGYSGIAGIGGPEPLEWARRALDLNPLAPAWWYSSLGETAFGAGEFDLAIDTMKRAPPLDPVSWLVTALAEAHLGNFVKARNAARRFRELAPNLTIEGYVGGTESDRPDQHRAFDAARLLGLPITDADLELAHSGTASALPVKGAPGDDR
jgi:TolB-like protein/tetratricopeptide (TPR) repeat protein